MLSIAFQYAAIRNPKDALLLLKEAGLSHSVIDKLFMANLSNINANYPNIVLDYINSQSDPFVIDQIIAHVAHLSGDLNYRTILDVAGKINDENTKNNFLVTAIHKVSSDKPLDAYDLVHEMTPSDFKDKLVSTVYLPVAISDFNKGLNLVNEMTDTTVRSMALNSLVEVANDDPAKLHDISKSLNLLPESESQIPTTPNTTKE